MWYGTGCAATGHATAARTRSSSGSIVAGPREQLSPTTSAPAASSRRHASSNATPSIVVSAVEANVAITAARLLHHLDRDHGLAEVVVRLGDHQVGALLDGPGDLLAVHLAHDRARGNGIVRVECPGVADVPGNERVTFGGDLGSEPQRVAVQRLEVALAADLAHLLAVTVVRERHHHLRAGAEELPVQLAHRVRKIEHDLGDVRPALQVATALELEQVALCAQHRPLGEPFEQAFHISIGGAAGQSRDRTPPRGRIARRNGRELLRPG